ncbi:MAG: hypothetical protein ABEJ07_03715 [Candidatus Nanohaloarchaea archaeon]
MNKKAAIFFVAVMSFATVAAAQGPSDDPIVEGPSLGNPVDMIVNAVTGFVSFIFDIIVPGDWNSFSETQQMFYGSGALLVLFSVYLIVYFGADELGLINSRGSTFNKWHIFGLSLILTLMFLGSGKFFFFANNIGMLLWIGFGFLLVALAILVIFGGIGSVYGALGWGSGGAKRGYSAYTGSPAQKAFQKVKGLGAAAGAAGVAGIGAVYSAYATYKCPNCGFPGPNAQGSGANCWKCGAAK